MATLPLTPSAPPASSARRRERNAAETRRRILDAAEVEFAAKGFDGARLSSIARAADAQSALIHHYFEDKAGLYRAVIARALDALSAEGWDILAQVRASIPPPSPSRAKSAKSAPKRPSNAVGAARARDEAAPAIDIPRLVAEFVGSMLRFYATHAPILAILRHEAQAGGALAGEVVQTTTKPVFDAVVALIDDLKRRGRVRGDVDARHVCLSGVAMVAWPFQEAPFVKIVFPNDVHDAAFLEARQRDIVDTILARLAP